MNLVQRIAKNTIILFLSRIIGQVLSFLCTIYIIRYLGPSEFGILAFGLAFTGIFGAITDFGFTLLVVREVAREKTTALKYFSNVNGIKLILAAINMSAVVLVIHLLGYPIKTIEVVFIIAIYVLFNSFTQLSYSIFQAYEKMEYQFVGQIFNNCIMLIGVFLAMKLKYGVMGFACLYPIASICTLGYSFFVLKQVFSKTKPLQIIELDWNFWKHLIKQALPFGLAVIFMTIFYWVDSVMLSLMKGDSEVGLYNAAYKIILFVLFIPHSFIAATYPVMSKYYKTSHDSLRFLFKKTFTYLTIIGIPMGVGTILLSEKMILLIFDTNYKGSILPLQILIWSSVFIFMSVPFANLLNCLNKQLIVTKTTGICVVLNVILNLIFIPRYGLIGASMTTVFTEFVSLLLCSFYGAKYGYSIFQKNIVIVLSKIILASLFMAIFIICFKELSVFILLPVAVSLYIVVLYAIKGICQDDISLIKEVYLMISHIKKPEND